MILCPPDRPQDGSMVCAILVIEGWNLSLRRAALRGAVLLWQLEGGMA